jgi:hypothetical protein
MRESWVSLSRETRDLGDLKRSLRTAKIIKCVDLNDEARTGSAMAANAF